MHETDIETQTHNLFSLEIKLKSQKLIQFYIQSDHENTVSNAVDDMFTVYGKGQKKDSKEIILDQDRFVVFNSRHLTGECGKSNVCNSSRIIYLFQCPDNVDIYVRCHR